MKSEKTLVAKSLLSAMPARLEALRSSPAARLQAKARYKRFGMREAALGPVKRVGIGGLKWAVPQPEGSRGDDFAAHILRERWLPVAEILQSLPWAMGRVMLDIGAHIGTTSIPRVVLGHFEAAYCAEPAPANYAALLENVTANKLLGFVMPDNIAIAAEDGELPLTISPRSTGHSLISGKRDSIVVPVRSLDSWVASLHLNPTDIAFIKSDIQGYEPAALRGARKLLQQRHIVWQIEFWPQGMEREGTSIDEMVAQIQQHFTHFVDVKRLEAPQVPQPVAGLPDAVVYLKAKEARFTNLLLMNL